MIKGVSTYMTFFLCFMISYMKKERVMFNIIIFSLLVGVITGGITFIFGSVLIGIVNSIWVLFPYNLLLLPIVGWLTVYVKNKLKVVEASTGQMYEATLNGNRLAGFIIPYQIIMTWLAHLSGASVGREGVAVQLGATVANNIASKIETIEIQNFTTVGMAAGFAGLFGTPLAATVFVIEVTKRRFQNWQYLVGALIAAFTANLTSANLGLEHFHVHVNYQSMTFFQLILFVVIIAIVGIGGSLFAVCLKKLKALTGKYFKNEYARIIVLSILFGIFIAILDEGRYMSLGTNIIDDAFNNPANIQNFDFLFKFLFTIAFLSIGYQGGEVTPLFTIGSSLGAICAIVFGLPVAIVAACSYGFFFGHASNAYFASFFMVIEVFGVNIWLYALLALIVSQVVKKKAYSIYPNLNWK